MPLLRTVAVAVLIVTSARGSLQQPPRDGRPVRQPPSALLTQAHEHYKAQDWRRAIEKYEAALAADPVQFNAYFFLANSYDNLYRPSLAGEPTNDGYIQKAIEHYTAAAQHDRDPETRKRALEFSLAVYGPDKLNNPSEAERIAQQMIAIDPADLTNYFALAKVYEDGGLYEDAEQTLLKAKAIAPRDPAVYTSLSGFYNRLGDFPRTMEALQQAAELEPLDPAPHQRVAVFYWEKAFRDQRLSPQQRREYILAGIAATDRALALDPHYVEALTYKNILLRMQANQETDRIVQAQLMAEADALRALAIDLSRRRADGSSARPNAPVSPPVPMPVADNVPAVRVGRDMPPPIKIKDVKPVYPPAALHAQGTVIIDVTIDTQGRVADARILRSVPLLDRAAVEAVRQWEYLPTSVNGVATPVVMTVTVSFTRQ